MEGKYVFTDESKRNLTSVGIVHCPNAASDQHSHYTQLSFIYIAMRVYTASQMVPFMNSEVWNVEVLNQHNQQNILEHAAWGYRTIPAVKGFEHANMVPIDPVIKKLYMIAAIEYLPNNYAEGDTINPLQLWDSLSPCPSYDCMSLFTNT